MVLWVLKIGSAHWWLLSLPKHKISGLVKSSFQRWLDFFGKSFGKNSSCSFWFLLKNKVRAIILSVGCRACRDIYGGGSGFQSASLAQSLPTKRAADGGESARFTSIFLAGCFFYSQAFVHPLPPSAANANRWVALAK
jgi:hypothetical protein